MDRRPLSLVVIVFAVSHMYLVFGYPEPELKRIEAGWYEPIDLAQCRPGEVRTFIRGDLSESAMTLGRQLDICVVEYVRGTELGYVLYECGIPANRGSVQASNIDAGQCYETGRGSFCGLGREELN
ncbi:MAG: hypothetical protein HY518_05610 [Candidatus Aenigmarchaeota archaeon]|nr:hypothetical protein [Candidatus Aenigmarchaeota archaeon]